MPMQRQTGPMTSDGSTAFVPPYPPSWFDRFSAWVDRLPGPAWFFYLVFGAAVVLAETAIQWRDGASPLGTFEPGRVWSVGTFAYLLALMHYLDKSAASAMASFRPLLSPATAEAHAPLEEDATFVRLSYQLTTLPPRPTLLVTIAGAATAFVILVPQIRMGALLSFLPESVSSTLSNLSVLVVFILNAAISFVLIYHTVHQMVQVSRIYSRDTDINIYQLRPLFALSLPGAYTGLGLILLIYLPFTLGSIASQDLGPLPIGTIVATTTFAGATFALPLVGAHGRLVQDKERRLAEASSRFEAATTELHRQLDRGDLLHMDQLNKAVATLEIEQNALRRIPTWPWQPGAVRGLLAALFLPVAVWAIQFLLARLLGA